MTSHDVTLPVDEENDLVLIGHLLQSCFQESDFLATSWRSHVVASLPFLAPTNHLKATQALAMIVKVNIKTFILRRFYSSI